MTTQTTMKIDGCEYSLLMGSDVGRDGVFLELYEGSDPYVGPVLAESFYSDVDGSISTTQYAEQVPAGAIMWLKEQAERRLPPDHRAT